MSFSGSGNPLSIGYIANTPQHFELKLDIPNKLASLTIDGTALPEAQDVRFTQTGAGGFLGFGCSPGGLDTLRFAADDFHIEGFVCQGVPVEQRSWGG